LRSCAGKPARPPRLPTIENVEAEADDETRVLACLGDAPCTLDTLSVRSGLTPGALLAILLPMELAGRVAQLPGGLYQKQH
jgi:DNA processing protein